MARAEIYLQNAERGKLIHDWAADVLTAFLLSGNEITEQLLDSNKVLLPPYYQYPLTTLAIDIGGPSSITSSSTTHPHKTLLSQTPVNAYQKHHLLTLPIRNIPHCLLFSLTSPQTRGHRLAREGDDGR